MDFQVNYVAIIVAAIVYMALGALWYSKWMFKTKYLNLTKQTPVETKGYASWAMSWATVTAVIMAYVLALTINTFQMKTAANGAIVAAIMWAGFTLTTLAHGYLWYKKPLGLFLIEASHYLISMIVMGAIIGGWMW